MNARPAKDHREHDAEGGTSGDKLRQFEKSFCRSSFSRCLAHFLFHQTFRKVSQLSSQRLSFLPVEINCWSNSWVGLWRNYHIHCYHDEVWICHGAMHMQWKCIKNWWNTICKNREHSSGILDRFPPLCKHSICLCTDRWMVAGRQMYGNPELWRSTIGPAHQPDRGVIVTARCLGPPIPPHASASASVPHLSVHLGTQPQQAKHILVVSMSQSSPPHIFHL